MTTIVSSSRPTDAEIARFNARVQKAGDCLLWTGLLDKDGYGVIGMRRMNRKAHRCQHRHCVNPQHLNAISASENSKRDSKSVGYINSQKTHCKRGHQYDRTYGGQRYCSTCEAAKTKRLRVKWRADGIFRI